MNINVSKDEVKILEDFDSPNENEYKITECHFTFDDFTNSFQVKRAIFTISSTNEMYETDIINNKCDIPSEVLTHEYETIKLGVYGYNIGNNDELESRFSPSYATFIVDTGSYKEGAESPEPITPSQYDLYSQALQEGLNEVANVDIDAEKVGNKSTVTITNRYGAEKQVEILDGEKGEDGYTPVKGVDYFTPSEISEIETTVENAVKTDLDFDNTINGINHEIDDIKAEQITQNGAIKLNKDDIATINANLINYSLVSETGSKIEFILDNTTYQMYARLKDKNNNVINTSNTIDLPIEQLVMSVEYDDTTKSIIITLQNGQQTVVPVGALISGLVSETQLQTTLQSYYTKTETNTLLNGKANVSDIPTKTSDLTNDSDYTTKTYVDGIVGDIESILETLDIGSGV